MPSFPLPAGFELPEGVEEGQDFDAVATFSLENGTLTVKAVEGAPIEGYEDPDAAQEPTEPGAPTESSEGEDFMSAVEKRMGGA